MLIFLSCQISVFSQEEEPKNKAFLGVDFRQIENQPSLVATLTARIKGERGRKRISDAEVEFYIISDTSETSLGKARTNEDGETILDIPEIHKLSMSEDGAYLFRGVFSGTEEFTSVSNEIQVKLLFLDLSFIEVDSVKSIYVEAKHLDKDGKLLPVNEEVVLFVPSQFNRLKIGEVSLEDGKGSMEFPITLPGDSIGNVQVIARIEDSKDFGTVEVSSIKEWGVARPTIIIEKRRGLGDTDAPLWMVYTLIVLMSAVWFHYLYLFYLLFRIKRKGRIMT